MTACNVATCPLPARPNRRTCRVHADHTHSVTPTEVEAVYRAALRAIKAEQRSILDEARVLPQSALHRTNDVGAQGMRHKNGKIIIAQSKG